MRAWLLVKFDCSMRTIEFPRISKAPPFGARLSWIVHCSRISSAASTLIAPAAWSRITVRVRVTMPPMTVSALIWTSPPVLPRPVPSMVQFSRVSSPPSIHSNPWR
eukprot:182363-Prymnesium_polylepis.2